MAKKIKGMTPKAAERIYKSTSKSTGGIIPKESFAARAKSAADKNSNI